MHGTTDALPRLVLPIALFRFGRRSSAPNWLGIYLIGSLANGGVSRRYRDIDIAMDTEAGLSTQTLDRVRGEVIALSADLGSRLSGPTGTLALADFLSWNASITSIMRLR
jgi:predicted nucleotidyltransferase